VSTATSHAHIVWANKPGCSRAVAEIWIGESDLWFTIFVDDNDNTLRIEVFPALASGRTHLIDCSEVGCLIAAAKRDLLAMVHSSKNEGEGHEWEK
jgi:hypothetical protein